MVLPSLLMRLFCFYTDFGIEYKIVIKPNDTFIDGYCRSVFQIKKIFSCFCCHSATNTAGNPLYKGEAEVVAARWEVAAKPHQPHPQPLPEREGSGCAQ